MLYSEPGLGKTSLCETFIQAAKRKTIVLRKTKSSAETLLGIKEAYGEAKRVNPCIVFIDDLDKNSQTNEEDYDDEAFVAIQSFIDSIKGLDVLTIATANNDKKLPASLLREGRCDRKIALEYPSKKEDEEIVKFYLDKKKVNPNLNYGDVAKMIRYQSCAALETILNDAAILATFKKKESIGIEDIVSSYCHHEYRNEGDVEGNVNNKEAAIYHEAGHLVVAEAIQKGCIGFVLVRSDGNGFTRKCADLSRRPENVLVALAGKAASELYYSSRIASFCQSDLGTAANMIKAGITGSGTLGLSNIQVKGHYEDDSQEYLSRLESLVRAELERFYVQAKAILMENREFYEAVVASIKAKPHLLYLKIAPLEEEHSVKKATAL